MKGIESILGYQTSTEQTNTDPRYLVAGSQNMIIDYQKKARIRPGNSRFAGVDVSLTPIRNSMTWNNSTGGELPIKFYDDEMEVYFGTVDGTAINAYKRIMSGLSTTEIPRACTIWKDSETLDVFLFVQGDDNLYEWGGGAAVVASITGTTITKAGTSTFAQNRFYAAANKTLVCVRTGTEYVYTGGESTLTLTGIADTAGLVAGDILIQKVVTNSNTPAADRNNHTISNYQNHVLIGSEDANEVYLSKNSDFAAYTYSTPRLAGEGVIFTLDGISKGFGMIGAQPVLFAGKDGIFTFSFEQITVGAVLAETVSTKKLKTGANQGCISPESIVSIGSGLIYLTNEPALRLLETGNLTEDTPQLKSLSNPIKPDFDSETWTNACAVWWKNGYYLSSNVNSRIYILEFMEDADGKLKRFWQTPQVAGIRSFFIYGGWLYGGSSGTPETFKLFDSANDILSDVVYNDVTLEDEKVPIHAIAKFAYNNFKYRDKLKNFDEYFVEGEITPSTTDLLTTMNYDFNGAVQKIEKTIDGSDEDILIGEPISVSLGQNPLAQKSLASALSVPDTARKFRILFEVAKEDLTEFQPIFETNELDRYFSILSYGVNAELSKRKNISIKK